MLWCTHASCCIFVVSIVCNMQSEMRLRANQPTCNGSARCNLQLQLGLGGWSWLLVAARCRLLGWWMLAFATADDDDGDGVPVTVVKCRFIHLNGPPTKFAIHQCDFCRRMSTLQYLVSDDNQHKALVLLLASLLCHRWCVLMECVQNKFYFFFGNIFYTGTYGGIFIKWAYGIQWICMLVWLNRLSCKVVWNTLHGIFLRFKSIWNYCKYDFWVHRLQWKRRESKIIYSWTWSIYLTSTFDHWSNFSFLITKLPLLSNFSWSDFI